MKSKTIVTMLTKQTTKTVFPNFSKYISLEKVVLKKKQYNTKGKLLCTIDY